MTANLSNSLLESNLAEADHNSRKSLAMTRRGLVKRGAALSVAGQTSLLGLGMLNPGLAHADSIQYKSNENLFQATITVSGSEYTVSARRYINQQNNADFWCVAFPKGTTSPGGKRAIKFIFQGVEDYQFSKSWFTNNNLVTFSPVLVEKNYTDDSGEFRRAQQINWGIPAGATAKVFYNIESGTESICNLVHYYLTIDGKDVQHIKYIYEYFVPGDGWVTRAIKTIAGTTKLKNDAILAILNQFDLAKNKQSLVRSSWGTLTATAVTGIAGMVTGGIVGEFLDSEQVTSWVIGMGVLAFIQKGLDLNEARVKATAEAAKECCALLRLCQRHYTS